MARFDVVGSAGGVLFGGQFVVADCLAPLSLFEVLLQVGNAPATPCSRAATLADLAGATRLIEPDVVDDLPLRDVEAITDFVVEVHGVACRFNELFGAGDLMALAASKARIGMTGARIRMSVQYTR